MASNNIYFDELKNITEDKVIKIFSKGKNASNFKPNEGENPTIIILVGSPGVGKTSTAKKIIPLIVGDKYSYDNFYNIALDSLVERVKPYREVTHSIYKELTKYKNGKLNNSNADFLSTIYLNTIMSTSQNFNLNLTRKKKISKIRGIPIHINKSVRNKTIKSLNDWRKEGLIYAAKNGLNIIYDTTLQSQKDVIKVNILSVLDKESPIKYNIITVLVQAGEETIKERIRGRHNAMLKENIPYIRAVSIPIVSKFIKMNEEAFDKAVKDYKDNSYISKNNINNYNKDDFKFYKVDNITGKEPVIENVTSE